jgi:hypothetical protein
MQKRSDLVIDAALEYESATLDALGALPDLRRCVEMSFSHAREAGRVPAFLRFARTRGGARRLSPRPPTRRPRSARRHRPDARRHLALPGTPIYADPQHAQRLSCPDMGRLSYANDSPLYRAAHKYGLRLRMKERHRIRVLLSFAPLKAARPLSVGEDAS